MDKNFIKLASEFNDKFRELPEDKAAKGSMTVTVKGAQRYKASQKLLLWCY
jgi:hypothetical protein